MKPFRRFPMVRVRQASPHEVTVMRLVWVLSPTRTLRNGPQNNFSLLRAQLQNDRIVDLDRMLFTVDADDEVNRRGPFNYSFDRCRYRFPRGLRGAGQ